MVIQHNIAALNAYRQLNTNTSSVGKNLEKLSSGYAINRAGDDASGLAISEKMRAQISGLQVAQKECPRRHLSRTDRRGSANRSPLDAQPYDRACGEIRQWHGTGQR